MIKYFHTCQAGHKFTKLTPSWKTPNCPVCFKEAMERIAGSKAKSDGLRRERLRPSYPITQGHTSTVKRLPDPPARSQSDEGGTFPAPDFQNFGSRFRFSQGSDAPFITSGGGGDFGGGGASASWQPAPEVTSYSAPSESSSSCDSSSSSYSGSSDSGSCSFSD